MLSHNALSIYLERTRHTVTPEHAQTQSAAETNHTTTEIVIKPTHKEIET
jgi:hypothetical protein